ncbi:MAG: hypothetical protein NZV14_08525 [Bryobacteraceae bacterium]|nr:hypothetical protein [Bryobacteraceae bacterium]MDW8378192.1 hypothetical protein [Bryobacterales bacterium]
MKWLLFSFFLGLLPLVWVQAQTGGNPATTPSPGNGPAAGGKRSTSAQAPWSIFTLAHPHAQLLLGLDWRRALASPLGGILVKQVQLGGHPLLEFLASIENVDRILVSSEGVIDGSRSLLVVGEGRFHLAKVRAMAQADGAIGKRYNDVEILVAPGATNEDLHFALLDTHTIAFGDGYSVKDAIDRWQRRHDPAFRSAVASRAMGLMQTHEIWAVATNLSETLSVLGLAATDLADQIEMFDIGLATGPSLSAQITIRSVSEETAQTLSTGLPALLQLAALQFSDQPILVKLSQRLKVVTEKNYLKMGARLEAKLLEDSLQALRAAVMASRRRAPTMSAYMANLSDSVASGELASSSPVSSDDPSTASAPRPQASPKSQRRTILVIGEEGVREIPYEPKSSTSKP